MPYDTCEGAMCGMNMLRNFYIAGCPTTTQRLSLSSMLLTGHKEHMNCIARLFFHALRFLSISICALYTSIEYAQTGLNTFTCYISYLANNHVQSFICLRR